MFSTRWLFLCLVFGAAPVFAQTFTTPFEGGVAGRFGRPISVRNAPPKATSVSYELGQYLCAAFPGSTFFATASQRVANGEVWYRIQIASSVQAHASACPAAATGWMVGEMRDGSAVIKLTVANVAPPSEFGTTDASASRAEGGCSRIVSVCRGSQLYRADRQYRPNDCAHHVADTPRCECLRVLEPLVLC